MDNKSDSLVELRKETEDTANVCRKFESLYSYNFEENVKFLQGWHKVKNSVPTHKLVESFIKAQVYFYSREIEPVTFEEYYHWLKDNRKPVKIITKHDKEIMNSPSKCDTRTEDNANKDGDEMSLENRTEDNANKDGDEMSLEKIPTDQHPQNFIELARMIQSGLTLPNIEDLNIVAVNEDPTPCMLNKPKKPWEKGSEKW